MRLLPATHLIITGNSREQLVDEIRPLLERFLEERGLQLSAKKTVVTHIEDGFDFLGQNVRKYNGKILIKPSKKNVKAFLAKVRGVIKGNPTMPTGTLIAQLNPIIRGWAQYHQHVVSKATFHSVDSAIFEALWRWARRRHPKKGAKWVKERYFPAIGSRRWVFSGKAVDGHGVATTRHLFRTETVPIKRHVKVQSAANPYDPAWEAYFAQRLAVKVDANLKGYRTLLFLWNQQNGLCPNCSQPITTITGWHNHHVGKPTCTVLRGGIDGNADLLPDRAVFLSGVEEGLVPHHHALQDDDALDGELRLLYVALTRVRERLYVSYCRQRERGGRIESRQPSRWLYALPPELLTQAV